MSVDALEPETLSGTVDTSPGDEGLVRPNVGRDVAARAAQFGPHCGWGEVEFAGPPYPPLRSVWEMGDIVPGARTEAEWRLLMTNHSKDVPWRGVIQCASQLRVARVRSFSWAEEDGSNEERSRIGHHRNVWARVGEKESSRKNCKRSERPEPSQRVEGRR